MKRIFALLLALFIAFVTVVGCSPKDSGGDNTPSSGTEDPVTPPAQDPNVVVPSMKKEWDESTERADAILDEIDMFKVMRRDRFLLPCNKQFYDRMDASIKQMEETLKDYPAVVYKVSVYDEAYTMEETWQDIMKMKNGGIGAGWMKNQGWYMSNISMYQGDIYYGTSYDKTEDFMFEILDETVADREDASNPVDENVLQAFKNVCIEYVVVDTVEKYNMYSAWMTKTTDVDSRTIEQIYYDMIGEGLDDNGVNNNPMCIEQGRKPYKDVSTENMKASLAMISARYTEFAEEFEALKPFADKFAAYAEAWNGVQ